ncbi:MAG: hypothetical protein OXC12_14075 [Spirochaetaceae bacterium]|nr:hypothetical protein [Spirochaetaceae bacterium]
MATPTPTAPAAIDGPPLVNGAPEREPSFAYTDLRGIGRVDIDELLDYVHDSAREFPSYLRLYEKYLKQRWDVTELDFATDARDWNERMSAEERETFLKMASGFHHGERQVTVCLGPLLMGIPEDYKIFLASHLEDEARHTIFFDRFYREVVGMPGDTIMDLLDESYPFVGDGFVGPFGLLAYLTDDLRRNPYDQHLLMQYAVTYMLWIEGVLALSSMKVTLGFARDRRVLPAYYAGFTATCRDEARHVQAGLRFIRELLNDDPGLVRDLHETMRTLLTFANTGSMRVDLGVLGWSAEREKAFRGRQLRKKLNLVGVALPADVEEMIDEMDPVMAGG